MDEFLDPNYFISSVSRGSRGQFIVKTRPTLIYAPTNSNKSNLVDILRWHGVRVLELDKFLDVDSIRNLSLLDPIFFKVVYAMYCGCIVITNRRDLYNFLLQKDYDCVYVTISTYDFYFFKGHFDKKL